VKRAGRKKRWCPAAQFALAFAVAIRERKNACGALEQKNEKQSDNITGRGRAAFAALTRLRLDES
jgi:hypothetical protein